MIDEVKRNAAEFEGLFRKISRIMNKRLRDSLSNSAITPPQFFALVTIFREEGLTMGELCDRMFLACSTVSGLIDRLEKMELVERYRDDSDRRVVRLTLTTKGQECTQEILQARREKLELDLDMVSLERQRELITNLNLLLEIMNASEHTS